VTFLAQCSFPSWFWKKTEISQNFGHFWDSLYQRFSVPGTSKSERFLAFFSGTGVSGTRSSNRDSWVLIGNFESLLELKKVLIGNFKSLLELIPIRSSNRGVLLYYKAVLFQFPIGSTGIRVPGLGYRAPGTRAAIRGIEKRAATFCYQSRAQRSIGLLGHHDTTAATLFSENTTM